jgi:hypothetical protein
MHSFHKEKNLFMEGFHPSMNMNMSMNPSFSYTFPITGSSAITNNITTTTTTFSNTTPWMNSRIWSKLPQRLLDRIIAFLPPPAFFRARSVCKRFYSLLFSNTFLQLYLQVSPRFHWFFFFKHKTRSKTHIYKNMADNNNNNNNNNNSFERYLFDPNEMTWYRISFGLIPSGFSPSSSSSGLLCFVSDESGPKTMLLWNPLLGSIT